MKIKTSIKQIALLLILSIFMASCASTGTNSTAKAKKKKIYDPTGTWEYVVDTPDGGSGGTMTIAGEPGAFTGVLSTDQFGDLQLVGLDIVDQNMSASIEVAGMGSADIEAAFEGDTFTGAVYLGEDAFAMEGNRVGN